MKNATQYYFFALPLTHLVLICHESLRIENTFVKSKKGYKCHSTWYTAEGTQMQNKICSCTNRCTSLMDLTRDKMHRESQNVAQKTRKLQSDKIYGTISRKPFFRATKVIPFSALYWGEESFLKNVLLLWAGAHYHLAWWNPSQIEAGKNPANNYGQIL